MRLWIKAACVAFVLTVLYSLIPFQAACADISGEVFRLHILANSDSEADQALKLKVRDSVLAYSEALFAQAKTKEEAESLTVRHLQALAQVAADAVRDNGYPYPVQAEIGKMFFTTRRYEKYTLPSGMYDALRLTIGEGRGHNWWCVMFPSLCVSMDGEGERRTKETLGEEEYRVVSGEKEYKFFIVELFDRLRGMVTGENHAAFYTWQKRLG